MSIRFRKKKTVLYVVLAILCYAAFFTFIFSMGASYRGITLAEYVRGGGISWSFYAVTFLFLVFCGALLTGVKEYRIDGTGITLIKVLGKDKYIPWDELAFVGPACVGQGRFRHKGLLYSRELPQKSNWKTEYAVNGKTSYELQDSPEIRAALKRYCPVYTEEYENTT